MNMTDDITANLNGNPNQLPNSPNQKKNPHPVTDGSSPRSNSGKPVGWAAVNANKKYTKLQGQLKDAVSSIGGGLLVIGAARGSNALQADGLTLLTHSDPLSEKLTAVAKENDAVYQALDFLMSSSVYGTLVLEIAGIAMAMASNHGVTVPGLPGGPGTPNPYSTLDQGGFPTAMTPDQWFAAKGA